MTLQAVFDDSGGKGQRVWVSMCGIFGSSQLIEDLADAWDKTLRARDPGRISYFKMDEAVHLRGEFADWSEANRDKKILQMANCLDRFRFLQVGGWMKWRALKQVEDALRMKGKHGASQPLIQLLIYCLTSCMSEAYERGYRTPIETVFDHNALIAPVVRREYDEWRDVERKMSKPYTAVMPEQPWFRDDTEYVALQAADLLAGERRLRAEKRDAELRFLHSRKLCPSHPTSRFYKDLTQDVDGLGQHLLRLRDQGRLG